VIGATLGPCGLPGAHIEVAGAITRLPGVEWCGEVDMKFDMGQSTLASLTKQTSSSSDDLGSLIRQLVDAVTPLEGTFNGAGRQAFDGFKARADEVVVELNASLQAIVGGQSGMDTAFGQGDTEMSDNASGAAGSANFDGARFGAR